MRALSKVLLVVLFIIAGSCVMLSVGLSIYDQRTRRDITNLAARELPPHASMVAMDLFMRKHTDRYALDDQFAFQFRGFIKQRKLDKLLLDRKISIALKFNAATKRYESCVVEIFYTFL